MSPIRTTALLTLLTLGSAVPAGAQGAAGTVPPPGQATPSDQRAAADALVRRLTVDEAVRMAIENNLGIRVARFNPQLEDLSVAQARAGWSPALTSRVLQSSTVAPTNSFLSGGQTSTTDKRLNSNVSVEQALPWGGSYSIGWDGSRSTTNNFFSNFSPQLGSSLAFHYEQPLMRDFSIDSTRQQLLLSLKNRDISDVQLQQTLTVTMRTVRNAYWDLSFAIASLAVQRQSLALADESLRNTRARVEIGTTPPIDVVEAEAEVATRQEAVILAEAQIETTQDAIRTLIYDPAAPDFWTVRFEPTDLAEFQPSAVDVNAAVNRALQRRTDLQEARRSLEVDDINIRYFRNQALPTVTANVDYGLTGLGGTRFIRGPGFPGDIIGTSGRSYSSVLGDLFGNQFPNWTIGLNVRYPIGMSPQDAGFARARLQQNQSRTQLRNQEVQIVSQVRSAGRQVLTNQQRVRTTRSSRELAERRLDAEQKKFTAGTSTSFIVFQAQRDLALAQNNELRAILDYNRSIVDLDTVQDAPINAATTTTGGVSGGVTTTGSGGAVTTGSGASTVSGGTTGGIGGTTGAAGGL